MRRRTMLLIAPNSRGLELTQWTFGQAGPHHTVRVVRDGEEALAYLLRQGAYTDPRCAPPPDVIAQLGQFWLETVELPPPL